MTFEQFSPIFATLAIQLRAQDANEGTARGYFIALKDSEAGAVAASAQAFAKEPDRRWFPTTAEWHQAAAHLSVEALRKALPAGRVGPWRHDCTACEDTGWSQRIACPGDVTCGRERLHAAHDFVRMCPCRPTNATWLRHQRFGQGAA